MRWLGRLWRGGQHSSTPSTVSARVSGHPLPQVRRLNWHEVKPPQVNR